VDGEEIRVLEEEEIYQDSRVPPGAVEIWRLARRQARELNWKRKTLDVLSVLLWAFHNGGIPTTRRSAMRPAAPDQPSSKRSKPSGAPASWPQRRPFALPRAAFRHFLDPGERQKELEEPGAIVAEAAKARAQGHRVARFFAAEAFAPNPAWRSASSTLTL
jgi:hypothetical protein